MTTIAKPTYDNEIKAQPSGSAYPWAASTGVLDVNFGDTIGTANAIQIVKDGYTFAWKPDTVEVMDNQGNLADVSTVNTGATAQVWKNQLTYVGTTPLTSDEFEVKGNQLKHTVRMVAPPRLPDGYTATPQYLAIGGDIGTTTQDWADIDLMADGTSHLSDFTTSDDLSFCRKSDGSEIYRIPHITAVDGNGQETTGQYKLTFKADNTVTMYMLVDWNWLQNAAYPVLIDPTVVVSGSYNIYGNGGRKLVRLSNGYIVAAVYDSTNIGYFYVSKDNGQTWSLLSSPGITYDAEYFAVACKDTTVYAIGWLGGYLKCLTVDATGALGTPVSISGLVHNMGEISVAIDGAGTLHVAYIREDPTYTSNICVYYNSSTDGGSTWAPETQVSSTSSGSWSGLNIIVRSDNTPVIFTVYSDSTPNHIVFAYVGSGFQNEHVYINASYLQSDPCAAIDSNGTIHLVWAGEDSTTTTWNSLQYSKSTDGGTTWAPISTPYRGPGVGFGVNYPSIAVAPNNDLYVFFQDLQGNNTNIYFIKYTAATGQWSSATAITSYSSGITSDSAQNAQAIWSEFDMNSSDAIRIMYSDTSANAIEYYSIILDNPPNAPILATVPNFDATNAHQFSWTFSDPDPSDSQSAYQAQVVDVASGQAVYDSGKVATTATSFTLAANKLTNGKQYEWRVTTWDSQGKQGPFSQYATFNVAAAPTVSITSPAAGSTDASSSVVAEWSYSDPDNNPQQSYQVQLTDSGGGVLWDSGVVQSQSARAQTVGYTLANNTSYQVHVTVTNSKNISSQVTDVAFSTSFTAPAQPTLSLSPNDGYISVVSTNPAPSGTEPTVGTNDIYRRESGTQTWTRIASMPPNTPYDDYAVAAEQSYDYHVTANGNNGTTIDSDTSSASIDFTGVWLHDPLDAENTVHRFRLMERGRTAQAAYPSTMMQFEGRTLPVADVSGQETNQVVVTIDCLSASDDLGILRSLIAGQNTLCYRDARGRKLYGIATAVPETETTWGTQVQLTMHAVDYEEGV